MKIGMNMLLWTDDPTQEKFFPLYERLKRMGFDGVELPVFNLDPARFAALGKRLDDLGLERSAVTVRTVNDNPISPDAAVRALSIEKTKLVLDCCHAGGMKVLAGPYYAALGHFTGAGPTAEEWAWGIESMRPVADYAQTAGVTLALEFLNRFEIYLLNCAADAARFVREVDRPACRMMYDTFHANIEEKDIANAIRGCASEMVHVHISENDRSTPGLGQVDWATTFRALKEVNYNGWLTIEAFGLALPALAAATKIWRRMYGSEEQLAADGCAFIKKMWNQAGEAAGGKNGKGGKAASTPAKVAIAAKPLAKVRATGQAKSAAKAKAAKKTVKAVAKAKPAKAKTKVKAKAARR